MQRAVDGLLQTSATASPGRGRRLENQAAAGLSVDEPFPIPVEGTAGFARPSPEAVAGERAHGVERLDLHR